jgi:hypothetical protein
MARLALRAVVIGLWLILSDLAAVSAEGELEHRPRFDVSSVAEQGSSVADFVPAWWTIEAQVEADLDRDAVDDVVLTLVEDLPAEDARGMATEGRRALLVLLSRNGGFTRAGSNDRLLQCTRCGGALYGAAETPVDVSIERGVIIVRQDWGARETTAETHRFRYDAAVDGFLLIGHDVFSVDRLGPTTIDESTNLLTGDYIRRETRAGETADDEFVSETREKVARRQVFLEDTISLNSE